ncbi:MAG: hypothetical protein HC912_08740 [Saprospiraceae bacterium]|nr:hypothetical protein [Saprospiraceae bacterium]
MDIRETSLTKLVRESDRYQALRSQYLSVVEEQLAEEIKDFTLRDIDIERILSESKKTGHIAELLEKKFISNDMASNYRKH